jgi:hypothetical protein
MSGDGKMGTTLGATVPRVLISYGHGIFVLS